MSTSEIIANDIESMIFQQYGGQLLRLSKAEYIDCIETLIESLEIRCDAARDDQKRGIQ
jgi:chaperonin cofactor prefoldin